MMLRLGSVVLTCSLAAAQQPSQFEYSFDDQRYGTLKPQFLSPSARGIVNIDNGQIVDDPEQSGNRVLRVLHPEGAVGPGNGSGITFNVDLVPTDRYWFSYNVRFEDDFVWRAGGKLPGLFGGDAATGGNPADGDGWSVRQMWFDTGRFAPYVYHMDQQGIYGDTLGGTASFGQGSRFIAGEWHHVAAYVQLNSDNNQDGQYKLFLDGLLIKDRDDLRFRNQGRALIDEFTVQTFFGGQSEDYSPVKDEYIYFDNMRVSQNVNYVFETLPGGTPDSAITVVPGDFNRDGFVDAADYTVWRDGLGTIYTPAAYNLWKNNFGAGMGLSAGGSLLTSAASVPEPAGLCIGGIALGMASILGRPRLPARSPSA